jgi:chromosome segregation ATPase
MAKNFSEKEFKEKLDMPLSNSNSKQNSELAFKKRKDPRSMTTEELEEYINKNKVDKSLNSSFYSQKNLNYSITNHQFKKENENSLNYNGDTLSKNLGVLNYNYLGTGSLTPNNNNIIKNPFIMNNSSNNNPANIYENQAQSNYQKEHINTNTSNISFDPNSDGEDKFFKFKPKIDILNSPNKLNSDTNFSKNIVQSHSNAANNYLKSLQDKNRSLFNENDELKKNFIEVSEILEKERTEFQKKINYEINKTADIERNLKNELNAVEGENKSLVNELNEIRKRLSLLTTNISILENEKNRHIELNSQEKENLQNEIGNLYNENEQNKNQINSITEENLILRDKLSKVININF